MLNIKHQGFNSTALNCALIVSYLIISLPNYTQLQDGNYSYGTSAFIPQLHLYQHWVNSGSQKAVNIPMLSRLCCLKAGQWRIKHTNLRPCGPHNLLLKTCSRVREERKLFHLRLAVNAQRWNSQTGNLFRLLIKKLLQQ